MRGGEEAIRTLFNKMSEEHEVTLLSSDTIDISSQHSIKGARLKLNGRPKLENGRIIYFKSNPLFNSPIHFLQSNISRVSDKLGINPYSNLFLDILRVYGWGPYVRGLYNDIMKKDYDIIHASIFPTTTSYLALKASLDRKIPFVFTPYYHYRLKEFSSSRIMRFMLTNSSANIACTAQERESLIEIGSPEERTFTVPLSFDRSSVADLLLTKDEAKKKFGLQDKFVILTHPWAGKGGIHVLEACSRLSENHQNIALLTMGQPELTYLAHKGRIEKTSPNLEIIDLGWVEGADKWAAFSASDVFALPSISDAFGMSYLNAWAAQLPVMGARNTSSESLINDGQDGALVEYGNVEDIAESLGNLIEQPGKAQSMGLSGLKKLQEKFNTDLMVKEYENVFKFASEKL